MPSKRGNHHTPSLIWEIKYHNIPRGEKEHTESETRYFGVSAIQTFRSSADF